MHLEKNRWEIGRRNQGQKQDRKKWKTRMIRQKRKKRHLGKKAQRRKEGKNPGHRRRRIRYKVLRKQKAGRKDVGKVGRQ